jgi:hypothetical protein
MWVIHIGSSGAKPLFCFGFNKPQWEGSMPDGCAAPREAYSDDKNIQSKCL